MSRVQSVERAFAVLAALAEGPIGVTDVSERAGLPKSTAARLLGSLAREGVVEQVPGQTRYRLGPRIVALAASAHSSPSFAGIARPLIAELAAAASEVAGLSVPDGFLVHYVDQVDSPNPVGVRDWTGTRIPMHAVSSGLMMLANLPPTGVDAFLARPLERFTERTVVDPRAVRERIRRAQVEGFAWTRDEFADGITSVAAAIADERGELLGAVHVHGPTYRFPASGDGAALAARVVGTAGRISASLRATA